MMVTYTEFGPRPMCGIVIIFSTYNVPGEVLILYDFEKIILHERLKTIIGMYHSIILINCYIFFENVHVRTQYARI